LKEFNEQLLAQGAKKNLEVKSGWNVHQLKLFLQMFWSQTKRKCLIYCQNLLERLTVPMKVESLRRIDDRERTIKGELKDQGMICAFVRYHLTHPWDVYRLLNLKSKYIMDATAIIWLSMCLGVELEE
jgi:hypothetical protein